MYLSRIQLNPARRETRRFLESPHVLHAAVLAAFPDPSARDTGRVLWRLDALTHRTFVYVVSPKTPDLTHLAEQAGWPTLSDSWNVRPYDTLLEKIENGQTYAFRLTANPVHSRRLPDGGRGKVYGHVTVAQQEEWLLSRQERLGMTIADAADDRSVHADGSPVGPAKALAIVDRQTLSFSRRETKVTLRVATYEGLLTVTDRTAFTHALTHGIGRAKGYGCGLLTLAPAV